MFQKRLVHIVVIKRGVKKMDDLISRQAEPCQSHIGKKENKMFELKPCPFCGGKAIFSGKMYNMEGDNAQQVVFTISCSKCDLSFPATGFIRYRFTRNGILSIYHDDRDDVVRKWNERIGEMDGRSDKPQAGCGLSI